MKNKRKFNTIQLIGTIIIMSVILWLPTAVFAQENPLKLSMTGHLAIFYNDDSGKEVAKLMPLPEIVEKGDIIQYDIVGENTSAKSLFNINAGGKIPKGTSYIDKSARCDLENEVLFSIDNGKHYAVPPIKQIVKMADGTKKEEEVSIGSYTDIRFKIKKLEPGQKFIGSYAVTVY